MLVALAGGLGLFLLGMVLLTDGLKSVAGRALKETLNRVVRGPVSGLASGAMLTAAVQSSSATTLTTIGFVSAGLITFPQAIGVILGANIGTTSTGWIVSVLGFKVSIGDFSLPLVFFGAVLRLIGRDRIAALGTAVAGFGLIFLGIDLLQTGMEGVAERVQPRDLPGAGLWARLLLVGLGVVMTVIMQSSSVAMAATLVALDSGTINFDQAAALVIGQNIGTTATAALAALGASVPARRTALAHILFNLLTGVIAVVALPLMTRAALAVAGGVEADGGVLALASFHTLFNIVGVAVLLPFLKPYARLIERILPQREAPFTRYLDVSVAEVGPVALEAARRAALAVLAALIDSAQTLLAGRTRSRGELERDANAAAAVHQINAFLARVAQASQRAPEMAAQVRLVHALDHLDELAETCAEAHVLPEHASLPEVAPTVQSVAPLLQTARSAAAAEPGNGPLPDLSAALAAIAELRRSERRRLLEETAAGRLEPHVAEDAIEAIRWADRVAYHVGRAVHYLQPLSSRGEPKDGQTGAVPAATDSAGVAAVPGAGGSLQL